MAIVSWMYVRIYVCIHLCVCVRDVSMLISFDDRKQSIQISVVNRFIEAKLIQSLSLTFSVAGVVTREIHCHFHSNKWIKFLAAHSLGEWSESGIGCIYIRNFANVCLVHRLVSRPASQSIDWRRSTLSTPVATGRATATASSLAIVTTTANNKNITFHFARHRRWSTRGNLCCSHQNLFSLPLPLIHISTALLSSFVRRIFSLDKSFVVICRVIVRVQWHQWRTNTTRHAKMLCIFALAVGHWFDT